jgi:hypothetical protein
MSHQSHYQVYKAQRWAEQQAAEQAQADQAAQDAAQGYPAQAPYLGPEPQAAPIPPVAPKAGPGPDQAAFNARAEEAITAAGDRFAQHVAAQAPQPMAQRAMPRGPRRLDPAAARRRRQAREAGFEFTLVNTTDDEGFPSVVRAKLPQIFDAETLASLPSELRQEIFKVVESVEEIEIGKTPDERQAALDGLSTADIVQQFGNIAHVVDAYCIAGFQEPRCYATAEEADEQGGVWVRDIEFADRMAFFEFCSRRERGGASVVKPFPDGPAAPVGAGSAHSPVSGAGLAEHGAPAGPEVPGAGAG